MHPLILASWFLGGCAPSRRICTCFPPPDPKTTAEVRSYVAGAAAVFEGTVVRIEHPTLQEVMQDSARMPPVRITLRVRLQWRGPIRDSIMVTTASFAEMCGIDFEEGHSYFVVADSVGGRPQTAASPDTLRLRARPCGVTRAASKARRIERLLDSR